MEKKDFFSKLNIKDYNSELESVLEKKDFSNETKNLILSMFYKIEVGYDDYSKVKGILQTKTHFMEKLIEIIKNNCDHIQLIKPQSDEAKELEKMKDKIIVDYNKKSLKTYPNEKDILYGILTLAEKKFNISHKILEKNANQILNAGYNMDKHEVVRSFDGFSWNIEEHEIRSLNYNLVYQNLQLLLGNENMEKWAAGEFDYRTELEKRYTKKNANRLIDKFEKFILLDFALKEKENKIELDETLKKANEELRQMEDKTKFISNVSENKKRINKQIKKIDESLNSKDLLIKCYNDRNSQLKEEEKIFSLSDFVQIIEKERQQKLEKIKELNEIIKPRKYIEKKSNLEKQVELIESIIDLKKENLYEILLELQKEFLKCIIYEIQKVETKKQVVEIIYKLRYYTEMPLKRKTQIKDSIELKTIIYQAYASIITRGCNIKAICTLSENIVFNSEIIMKILATKITNLETIEIELNEEENTLNIQIFDEENLESVQKIGIPKKIPEFKVKFKRKIKLFI